MKPVKNHQGPEEGENRVSRGGGWHSIARRCHTAFRNYWHRDYSWDDLGFRLAFSPPRKGRP